MARLDWTPPNITEYAEYSWNTDYAADVHELQRNYWTDRGLNGSDLPNYMKSQYHDSIVLAFRKTVEYLGERFQAEVPQQTGRLKASFKIEYKLL